MGLRRDNILRHHPLHLRLEYPAVHIHPLQLHQGIGLAHGQFVILQLIVQPQIPNSILRSRLDARRVVKRLSAVAQAEKNNRGRSWSSPVTHRDCFHSFLFIYISYKKTYGNGKKFVIRSQK